MFEGIVGNRATLDYLAALAKSPRRAHAYLFTGPEGVGKTAVAREWARALLSHTGVLTAHPDYYEVAGDLESGAISVDAIRSCNAFVAGHPLIASCKVVLLPDAERMHDAAGDALLKTLEEPAGDRVIIITATHRERVLPTIVSRAQVIAFDTVPRQEMALFLAERYPEVMEENRAHAALRAGGRPGRAVFLLEDPQKLITLAERERGLAAALRGSKSAAMRFLHTVFLPLKESSDKVKRGQEILEGTERILHEECLRDYSRVSKRASLVLQETRQALAHNISPQHATEHLLLQLINQ